MPKKFKGENTKATAARERKAATKQASEDKKRREEEDVYWQDDDKHAARKQEKKVSVPPARPDPFGPENGDRVSLSLCRWNANVVLTIN